MLNKFTYSHEHTFNRRNHSIPKIGVESFILMIEHLLVSILFNLTRATLLSLRNHISITIYNYQPRTQGTFWNESTLVDRGHVVSLYAQILGNKTIYYCIVPMFLA